MFGAACCIVVAALALGIGSAPTASCPGSAAAPSAAPGNLCVYESHAFNHTSVTVVDPVSGAPGASAFGAGLLFRDDTITGAGDGSTGTWAVTAP